MSKPAQDQINAIAQDYAIAVGGWVNVRGSDLALTVDGRFDGMTDQEFADVRDVCLQLATRQREIATSNMWAPL